MSYCVNARLVLARENGGCVLQIFVDSSAGLKALKSGHIVYAHPSRESAEFKEDYMQVGYAVHAHPSWESAESKDGYAGWLYRAVAFSWLV